MLSSGWTDGRRGAASDHGACDPPTYGAYLSGAMRDHGLSEEDLTHSLAELPAGA